jgi:Enoyl-CoA hydratase/isomerase
MGAELIEAFDRADADDAVRVIVVTGAGRGFCAGADLASGGDTFDFAGREPEQEVHRDGAGRFTLRVFESLKPVIAAINGPAVGVGATMTLPMDIRLASEDARIGFVFARRGIVPEACSSWFLPRLVSISRAMEWVATGRVFSAGVGRPGPTDDVDDARRRASDDRPPCRLSRHVPAGPVRRRSRACALFSGEARSPVQRSGQRWAAGHPAGVAAPWL